jgi:beta-N-acetylhexosaminidase
MVIVGYPGTEFTEDARHFIREFQPGGFVFFKDNCDTVSQIKALIKSIRAFYKKELRFVPWLSIDHEGGKVHRLPEPITHFPSAKELGSLAQSQALFNVGSQMASDLADLGFNLNFAPVCDVRRASTPIYLTDRIFSDDPSKVADYACHLMAGLHHGGILACAKHFPGLGSSVQDPHRLLAVSSNQRLEFETIDWVPFRKLTNLDLQMIMTTHLKVPALDEHQMATFSHTVVKEFLRRDLKFQGIVISDDLAMGAVSLPLEDAVLETIIAGHNLVMVSNRSFQKNADLLEQIGGLALSDRPLNRMITQSFDVILSVRNRPPFSLTHQP